MIVKGGFIFCYVLCFVNGYHDNNLKLNGKTFVFQIQLNEYNLKFGWEFYIDKKVFDSVIEIDKNN